jgi:hypothetical protein
MRVYLWRSFGGTLGSMDKPCNDSTSIGLETVETSNSLASLKLLANLSPMLIQCRRH